MFLTSRFWATEGTSRRDTGDAGLLDLDDDGWVRGFTTDGSEPPFSKVTTTLFTDNQSIEPGRYIFKFEGEGEVGLSAPDQNVSITQLADNRYAIDIGEGYVNSTVRIVINETDPNDTGDYLRDFVVVREADEAAFDAGEIFLPEFIDKIEDFRTLRFMNWMKGVDSEEMDWADRTTPTDARYNAPNGLKSGVPVEVMVELANEVRADPWFTIPHLATDDYVIQFATYVRDNLDDGLVARFEYSNEVWNRNYPQNQWAAEKASDDLGVPISDIPQAARQAYGIRAAEIAEIVADVFGNETGDRALNVFGTQATFLGAERWSLEAPDYVAAGYDAPSDAPFHVYAIAPYFANAIATRFLVENVYEWIDQGEQGFLEAIEYIRTGPLGQSFIKLPNTISHHADVAGDLGWQLEAYEGGQNITDNVFFQGSRDPARTQFFHDLVDHPGFADLYTEYFEIWRDNGGGLMTHFTDIKQPNQFNALGMFDSVFSDEISPRAQAIIDWRDNEPIYWDDDRPASTFEPGGGNDPEPEPEPEFEVGTDRNDRFNGTADADFYDALAGNDRVNGRAGDDVLHGGDGNDRMSGADGNDTILGQDGNDILLGRAGDDVLEGGDGGDRIAGADGDDVVNGGEGDDFLFTGAGNDTAIGGAGDDVIELASGNETVVINAGDGNDTIVGFDKNGDDVLEVNGLGAAFDEVAEILGAATQVGNDVVIDFGNGQTVTLEQTAVASLGVDDITVG